MLGDNPEKSKNPLKKAMRRRNAKTVQFTGPQYYEPPEIDYSDEEEDGSDFEKGDQEDLGTDEQETQQEIRNVEAVVEPLRVKSQPKSGLTNGIKAVDSKDDISNGASEDLERGRTSEEIFEKRGPSELAALRNLANQPTDESRSRNGTVRNTDSFFKDDTVETKKISLTPRLLRNSTDASASAEAQEVSHFPYHQVFCIDSFLSYDRAEVLKLLRRLAERWTEQRKRRRKRRRNQECLAAFSSVRIRKANKTWTPKRSKRL